MNTRRRLHLQNDNYHDKSDAELLYILQDAGAAASAMRNFDSVAECKYLDQVNDAASVLAARRTEKSNG